MFLVLPWVFTSRKICIILLWIEEEEMLGSQEIFGCELMVELRIKTSFNIIIENEFTSPNLRSILKLSWNWENLNRSNSHSTNLKAINFLLIFRESNPYKIKQNRNHMTQSSKKYSKIWFYRNASLGKNIKIYLLFKMIVGLCLTLQKFENPPLNSNLTWKKHFNFLLSCMRKYMIINILINFLT